MMPFAIRKNLRATYDEALVRVPEVLATEGFGVLTEIDVYEDDERRAVVLAIDPTKTVAASGNATLARLAEDVKERLTRVLEKLE